MSDTKSILWRVRQVAEIAKLPDTGDQFKDSHRAAARKATIGAVPVLVDALERLLPETCDLCNGDGCPVCDYYDAETTRVIRDTLAPLATRQRKDKLDG
ncbi:MAG: hypothetical protein GTN71_02950 [Anaerolineae bacterium]|nr:hypothetical protein [Anaerolineae bacterium]